MTSTFHGLELGKRALFAQQAALNTTGHNISNSNTAGYTRQRAEMVATPAMPYPGFNNDVSPAQIGTGVEVNSIVRLREDYSDVQYRGQNKDLGYYEATSDSYTKIEEILKEPSDTGIANSMDQFWQSWEELSKNSDSAAARAIVRQRGVAVTESFQYVNDSLNQMTSDLNNVISVKVDDVNSIVKQIADVNGQIARVVPNNYQPNDLYDKRDLLIDQLSKLVNVDVKPSDSGMVDVFVSGQALVQGQNGNTVTYSQDDTTHQVTVNIGGNPVTLQSGELQGRIDAVSKIIPNIQTSINKLASEFAGQVNTIHEQGFNLDDIANPANQPTVTTADKLDFFTQDANGNWVVNPVIMNPSSSSSLNKIAAATKVSVGDGTNAQAIANIKTNKITNLGSTADDFYRNIIGQLGVDSQQAQQMQDNTQSIVDQVDNRRQSVSGVSLDEEMSNMIKFQQSYNAAARLVNVMDEVLDKVINGMGH